MSGAQEITNPNAITARHYTDRLEALPACPQPETRSCRCACASRPRRFDSCIQGRAPPPAGVPGERSLNRQSPQRPGGGEMQPQQLQGRGGPGGALAAGRGAVRAGPLPRRAPRPRRFRRARAAPTAGKNYRAPAGPSPGRARAPVIGGMVCSTHVPLFGPTTCSVCTAACGATGGNRTNTESSRNSQALLGSGWAGAG